MWAVVLVLLVLMIVYAALTIRYIVGQPNPRTDYAALLHGLVQDAPLNQRAWPVYHAALGKLFPRGHKDIEANRAEINAETHTENWQRGCDWVRANRDVIAQIQRGTKLPVLGVLTKTTNGELYVRSHFDAAFLSDQPLLRADFPYADLNLIATLLFYDAWDRIDNADPASFESVRSLIQLADQVHRQPFAATLEPTLRIQSLNLIDFALSRHPRLWGNANLIALAHVLAPPRVAGDLVDTRRIRIVFYDVVQHIYTDDGAGDGRITPAGTRLLAELLHADPTEWPGSTIDTRHLLIGGATAMIASRKEMLREYDSIMDQFDIELRQDARDVGQNCSTARLERIAESKLQRFHYLPIELGMPRPSHLQWFAERYLAQRDGIEVAIALELFHRKHGAYPKALSELVPDYLPAIPADRITGEPLHYRLANDRPIVYSVGIDRDDDGGVIARSKAGYPMPWLAVGSEIPTCQMSKYQPMSDGDWILYPQPDPRD
jgi:hypothetical protein